MGHYIVKPTQDEDLYVMMNSIVDEPIAWGPRKRWIKWALKPNKSRLLGLDARTVEMRLDRADKMSCDSRVLHWSWDEDEKVDWRGVGYVLRSDLKWIAQLMELGALIGDEMITPFVVYTDDEDEPITAESEWPNG